MMKICIVGYGRAGKDEAGEYLARVTPLRFAGTTSKYLTKYVAPRLGLTEEEAYRTRHASRGEWYRIGKELRANDPGILIRESLADADIIGGIRDRAEILHVRKLVDLIIWIENSRVPKDPTVEFGPRHCDVIVQNNWELDEYHRRLDRLASALGFFTGSNHVQRTVEPLHPSL